jgi:predicted DCC family thiol-disulfide oxidoreductase YuxK
MTTTTVPPAQALTIVYDETCALCRRARDWLLTQPCLVDVELIAAGSDEAKHRYGALPWLGNELVAVDEHGNAWIGPSAFLASMWATAKYRPWAFRLATPKLAPKAEHFFMWISKRRDTWSSWLAKDDPECSWCDEVVERQQTEFAVCEAGHRMVPEHKFCTLCGARKL